MTAEQGQIKRPEEDRPAEILNCRCSIVPADQSDRQIGLFRSDSLSPLEDLEAEKGQVCGTVRWRPRLACSKRGGHSKTGVLLDASLDKQVK
jgi:hypothetical protein